MKIRKIIYADAGKILTNGEIYGKSIFLAEGVDASDFYEIGESEYEAIMSKKEKEEEAI